MPQRKYTEEQLQAELDRPRKKGGRPRKYATEEEARAAHHARIMIAQKRARIIAQGGVVPPELMPTRVPRRANDDERKMVRREYVDRYLAEHADQCKLAWAATKYKQKSN